MRWQEGRFNQKPDVASTALWTATLKTNLLLTALAGSSPISLEAPTDPKVLPFPTEISDTLTAVHLQPCKLQLLPLFRMALPVETHIPQKPLQSVAHCVLIIQTM